MADTRSIPSPSDEQLKELEKMNERARRRVRDIEIIHREIERLVDEKAAMTALLALGIQWICMGIPSTWMERPLNPVLSTSYSSPSDRVTRGDSRQVFYHW